MNNSTVFSSQESSDSSDSSNSSSSVSSYSSSSDSSAYQHSSLSLNAVNLRQPHLLKINSSATQLTGEITVNGKVVKRFSHSREEINLSPLLSVGEQKVQISARYAPASSSVNLQLNGPGTNVTQQTSGNGKVNYTLDLSVR